MGSNALAGSEDSSLEMRSANRGLNSSLDLSALEKFASDGNSFKNVNSVKIISSRNAGISCRCSSKHCEAFWSF